MAYLAEQSCSFCWASAIAIGFRMLLQYALSPRESFLFLGLVSTPNLSVELGWLVVFYVGLVTLTIHA